MLANLAFNLIIPILLLTKANKVLPDLNPAVVLIVALLFPISYFFYDLRKRKEYNFFSIIGMVSVLMTGGIGLMKLSPMVFAIKEASFPLLIGVAVVASMKTKNPLIKLFLLNPSIMDMDKVNTALDSPEKKHAFENTITKCTWIFASSFLISAIINFIISRMVVTTDPNIDQIAYNNEVGQQTGITWVVLTIVTMPIMILSMLQLFKGIKNLTGYGIEEIMIDSKK